MVTKQDAAPALGVQLRLAATSVPPELPPLREQFGDIVAGLAAVSADLQEISRGIHPAILSNGGLGPALKTLARRSTVPVDLDLAIDRRLPDSVEVGAYYVVSEALTNAAKHARASVVKVAVETHDAQLHLSIRDDGIGGADSREGSADHEPSRKRDIAGHHHPTRQPVTDGRLGTRCPNAVAKHI